MRRLRNLCLAIMAGLASFAGPLAAAEPALDKTQIEQIVHDYLMRNPEVVYQALQELQRRQTAAKEQQQKDAIAEHRAKLVADATDPSVGPSEADVTLVEFFDYRCTYCRKVVDQMQALIAEQPKLKVVFKEFPVLGEDSLRAAKAALASRKQGEEHYLKFHFALMRSPDLSDAGISAAAQDAGLDPVKLAQDMADPEISRAIERNYTLATTLGIEGTPAFVIGDTLVPGAVGKERLVALIEEARSNCVSC